MIGRIVVWLKLEGQGWIEVTNEEWGFDSVTHASVIAYANAERLAAEPVPGCTAIKVRISMNWQPTDGKTAMHAEINAYREIGS